MVNLLKRCFENKPTVIAFYPSIKLLHPGDISITGFPGIEIYIFFKSVSIAINFKGELHYTLEYASRDNFYIRHVKDNKLFILNILKITK